MHFDDFTLLILCCLCVLHFRIQCCQFHFNKRSNLINESWDFFIHFFFFAELEENPKNLGENPEIKQIKLNRTQLLLYGGNGRQKHDMPSHIKTFLHPGHSSQLQMFAQLRLMETLTTHVFFHQISDNSICTCHIFWRIPINRLLRIITRQYLWQQTQAEYWLFKETVRESVLVLAAPLDIKCGGDNSTYCSCCRQHMHSIR